MNIQGNLFDLLQQYDALLKYSLEYLVDKQSIHRETYLQHYQHIHEKLEMYKQLAATRAQSADPD